MATSTGSSKLIMEVFHTSTVSVTDQFWLISHRVKWMQSATWIVNLYRWQGHGNKWFQKFKDCWIYWECQRHGRKSWEIFQRSPIVCFFSTDKVCVCAIVCFPGCDVINFEINFIFLIKPFSYITNKSRQKFKYLQNKKIF